MPTNRLQWVLVKLKLNPVAPSWIQKPCPVPLFFISRGILQLSRLSLSSKRVRVSMGVRVWVRVRLRVRVSQGSERPQKETQCSRGAVSWLLLNEQTEQYLWVFLPEPRAPPWWRMQTSAEHETPGTPPCHLTTQHQREAGTPAPSAQIPPMSTSPNHQGSGVLHTSPPFPFPGPSVKLPRLQTLTSSFAWRHCVSAPGPSIWQQNGKVINSGQSKSKVSKSIGSKKSKERDFGCMEEKFR